MDIATAFFVILSLQRREENVCDITLLFEQDLIVLLNLKTVKLMFGEAIITELQSYIKHNTLSIY